MSVLASPRAAHEGRSAVARRALLGKGRRSEALPSPQRTSRESSIDALAFLRRESSLEAMGFGKQGSPRQMDTTDETVLDRGGYGGGSLSLDFLRRESSLDALRFITSSPGRFGLDAPPSRGISMDWPKTPRSARLSSMESPARVSAHFEVSPRALPQSHIAA